MSSHVGVTAFTTGAGGLKVKNSDGQKNETDVGGRCVLLYVWSNSCPLAFYILDSTPVLPVKRGATQVKQNQAAAVVVHADSLEMPCFANKNITAINFIN